MTTDQKIDVDIDTTASLKGLMGAGYAKLVHGFLGHTETYIGQIESSLRAGDKAGMIASAHKMKSSCGQFGLFRLQQLAALTEYSEGLDNAALLALHKEMKLAFHRALAFMQANGLDS